MKNYNCSEYRFLVLPLKISRVKGLILYLLVIMRAVFYRAFRNDICEKSMEFEILIFFHQLQNVK